MKPTYEDKIKLLERYIERPQGMHDIDVLRAIKVDVVKASVAPWPVSGAAMVMRQTLYANVGTSAE